MQIAHVAPSTGRVCYFSTARLLQHDLLNWQEADSVYAASLAPLLDRMQRPKAGEEVVEAVPTSKGLYVYT